MSDCAQDDIARRLAHWPANLLGAVAGGAVEMAEAAHYELSLRGCDAAGRYIGHEQAAYEYLNAWGGG